MSKLSGSGKFSIEDEVEDIKSIFCPLARCCGWYGYLDDCAYHIKRDHLHIKDETKYVNVVQRHCKSFSFQVNVGLRLRTSTCYKESLFVPWIAMMTWCGYNFIFHCTFKRFEQTYYIGMRIIGNEQQANGFTFCAEVTGDSFIRNYGPFPVALIGNGSYNETDFMSITAKDIQTLYNTNLKQGNVRAFRLTGKIFMDNESDYQKAVENFQQKTNYKLTKRIKKKSKTVKKEETNISPPPKLPSDPTNPFSLITSSSARCFALPSFDSTFQPMRASTSGNIK